VWLGGTCHPDTEILCPASGQWWDLHRVLDTRKSGLTVLTDEASATASVATSLLVAQEPWSSCHTDTSVSISVVCATDSDGLYEPCGSQLGIGMHTIVLIASNISDVSEIRATTSFILTVEDQEPPRLNKDACPMSSVATWMSSVYASVSAADNSGEVRITACTTDILTEQPTEPVVLTGRRTRMGFVVEPSAVAASRLTLRCIASSVSGNLVGHFDVAAAGPGQWLVITAEDLSGNVDRCDSLASEW